MYEKISDRFRKLADAIDRSADPDHFGGAALIIPPETYGVPEQSIELLILDPAPDSAQFFSTIVTRIQLLTKAIDERRMQQQGWGGMR